MECTFDNGAAHISLAFTNSTSYPNETMQAEKRIRDMKKSWLATKPTLTVVSGRCKIQRNNTVTGMSAFGTVGAFGAVLEHGQYYYEIEIRDFKKSDKVVQVGWSDADASYDDAEALGVFSLSDENFDSRLNDSDQYIYFNFLY